MASLPKFFVANDCISDNRLVITGPDALHILRVLRLRTGDRIAVSDMHRNEYTATIVRCGTDEVECEVVFSGRSLTESPFFITMYQAFPKGDKLELAVQKAVELGVSRIVPVFSERCVARPDEKAVKNRIIRLQKISRAAAQQSGRGIIPEISAPVSFDEMLDGLRQAELGFVCHEAEETLLLRELLSGRLPKSISFFIGPEGGISETETEKISSCGIPSVSLGRRILRTETAGLYVLSAISAIME